MVFDLGKSTSDVFVTDIKLEEIVLEWPTVVNDLNIFKTTVYPNPATDKIYINNLDEFKEFSIINLQGAIIRKMELKQNINQINLENLTPGMYFIAMTGGQKNYTYKILKK